MKKAMVLGAGGWLGDRLTERLLESGREVICIDVRLGNKWKGIGGVETIETDIRDLSRFAPRLAECAVVFNCCGVLHPKSTREIYAVNRDMPVALYKQCMEQAVDTFVHISSMNAHGENASPAVFLDETMQLRPITHYGVSKAQSDELLASLAVPGKTRLIILRPGVFYGVRPSKNLREFMDKLQTSSMPLFSERGLLRTYVDIDKVVDALILSERHGQSGEAYFIGDREPLSTLRFYQIVADQLGCKLKTVRVPLLAARICERLAFFAGRLGIHIRLLTIVGEFGRNTFCTSTKAARDLEFLPHSSSEAGLRSMVRSVQSQ